MTDSTNQIPYEKLRLYVGEDGKLIFDINKQPTVAEFSSLIGEEIHPAGRCVLNTPENFPPKLKKNGKPYSNQREYFKTDTTYQGKKVDYVPVDETKWDNPEYEWLYCLTYNGRIVKTGMTITPLKERWCGSYSCGTSRAMEKGSCSTTNFIISECNAAAVLSGMKVEIYAIQCKKEEMKVTRFGLTETIYTSAARSFETMLSKRFRTTYGHKPVLCVQEGK
jgi:hypothetical protein